MLAAYFLGFSLGVGFALLILGFATFASSFRVCFDIPD